MNESEVKKFILDELNKGINNLPKAIELIHTTKPNFTDNEPSHEISIFVNRIKSTSSSELGPSDLDIFKIGLVNTKGESIKEEKKTSGGNVMYGGQPSAHDIASYFFILKDYLHFKLVPKEIDGYIINQFQSFDSWLEDLKKACGNECETEIPDAKGLYQAYISNNTSGKIIFTATIKSFIEFFNSHPEILNPEYSKTSISFTSNIPPLNPIYNIYTYQQMNNVTEPTIPGLCNDLIRLKATIITGGSCFNAPVSMPPPLKTAVMLGGTGNEADTIEEIKQQFETKVSKNMLTALYKNIIGALERQGSMTISATTQEKITTALNKMEAAEKEVKEYLLFLIENNRYAIKSQGHVNLQNVLVDDKKPLDVLAEIKLKEMGLRNASNKYNQRLANLVEAFSKILETANANINITVS